CLFQWWFEFFHVIRETTFICRCAPLPAFRKVVDVCCGMGRHAQALSKRGYSVTGIDRDSYAIAKARALIRGPSYVKADIRDYRPEPDGFDLAISLSQSFGYFDATTNRYVLARLAGAVHEGVRVILDLCSAEFFVAHQGRREFKTPGGVVR